MTSTASSTGVEMRGAGAREQEAKIAADLAARIHAGEQAAETEMVERYARGLLLMLRARTHDPELAADLRQEVFCIALKRLRAEPLKEPKQLSAYLYGIARSLFLGDLRKTTRRATYADSELVARAADAAPTQLEMLGAAQLRHLIRGLLKELNVDRDRQILTRFYVDEHDKTDICRDLELDSAHFNRVLFRARGRFRELLDRTVSRDNLPAT